MELSALVNTKIEIVPVSGPDLFAWLRGVEASGIWIERRMENDEERTSFWPFPAIREIIPLK